MTCWPVKIEIEGFRAVSNEAIFVDMDRKENDVVGKNGQKNNGKGNDAENTRTPLGLRHPGTVSGGSRYAQAPLGSCEIHRHEIVIIGTFPIKSDRCQKVKASSEASPQTDKA